jgi:hypothetical protein
MTYNYPVARGDGGAEYFFRTPKFEEAAPDDPGETRRFDDGGVDDLVDQQVHREGQTCCASNR